MSFKWIFNVFCLLFNSNQIKEIDPNIFNGLTYLRDLDFSHNQIKEIDPNIFKGLANLALIKFDHNEINEIKTKEKNTLPTQ